MHTFSMGIGRFLAFKGGWLWNNVLVKGVAQNLRRAKTEPDQLVGYDYSESKGLWGSGQPFPPVVCSSYCSATAKCAVLLIKNC